MTAIAITPPMTADHARRRAITRSAVVGGGLAVAVFAVFCVTVSVGDFPIPLRDVVPAIFGRGDEDAEFIVRTLRLPRALTGLLVGAGFGVSGAIFQSLARNPLASPDVIGVNAGASAAAVFGIVVLDAPTVTTAYFALGGAIAVSTVIYLLAWKDGVSPFRFVLIGIGAAMMMQALTQYLLTRAEIFQAARATVWLTGSLNGRGWDHVRAMAVAGLAVLPVLLFLLRPLRALQLGDDSARGLGVAVEPARFGLILVAVVLGAIGVAAAGPIAFVAFVAGPIARRLTRQPLAIGTAALVGALLVLLADLVARRTVGTVSDLFGERRTIELPVGVVTGILGAPYLLWLLARANRVGRGG